MTQPDQVVDTQQQPFQVVLVDIKKAANDKIIHCVEKPLEGNGEDLKFVALSYRWGELQETMIDTKVGYTATVTSFNLDDFYQLCYMMTLEFDLRSMEYVWVDAICVDQNNYEKRKATIYQMTNIYERANHILAVPDLHSTYLKNTMIKNNDIMGYSKLYYKDIYYLLHGHADQLDVIEQKWLDFYNVPKDPALRQLLTKYTDHFADGLMTYKEHHKNYHPSNTLHHICKTHQHQQTSTHGVTRSKKDNSTETYSFKSFHDCDLPECPLYFFYPHYSEQSQASDHSSEWQQRIHERSTRIRQSMEFLTDLIVDWSSRVWVISEFHIAKKKNNLKYWFMQLTPTLVPSYRGHWLRSTDPLPFTFFKFNFDDAPAFSANMRIYATEKDACYTRKHTSNPVYIRFHYHMIRQLHRQSFLQMMLQSKASKNEDRFYSILPLSEYKTITRDIDTWNIRSLSSVKFKLFEIMHTKDKLNLLFMAGSKTASNIGSVLPTFTTSTVAPNTRTDYLMYDPCNFDLQNASTIRLHHYHHHSSTNTTSSSKTTDDEDSPQLPFLSVKPMEYCSTAGNLAYFRSQKALEAAKQWIRHHVDIDDDDDATMLDVVCIPAFGGRVINGPRTPIDTLAYCIFLIGHAKKNIWILDTHRHHRLDYTIGWRHRDSDQQSVGFHIY